VLIRVNSWIVAFRTIHESHEAEFVLAEYLGTFLTVFS